MTCKPVEGVFETLTESFFKATGQNGQWAKTNYLSVPIVYLSVQVGSIFVEELVPLVALAMAVAASVSDLFAGTIHAATKSAISNTFRLISAGTFAFATGSMLGAAPIFTLAYTVLILAVRIFTSANVASGEPATPEKTDGPS